MILCGIPVSGIPDAQTQISVSGKKGSHAIMVGNPDTAKDTYSALSPMFSHYIELVLAAYMYTGQKGGFEKCFILLYDA